MQDSSLSALLVPSSAHHPLMSCPVFMVMSCGRQSLSPWNSHAGESQEGSLRTHMESPGRSWEEVDPSSWVAA